jgi:hypothetical protein
VYRAAHYRCTSAWRIWSTCDLVESPQFPLRPVYPPETKAAGIEGTLKVFAKKDVDLAWVVSGPEQRRDAALVSGESLTSPCFLIDGKATVVNVTFGL